MCITAPHAVTGTMQACVNYVLGGACAAARWRCGAGTALAPPAGAGAETAALTSYTDSGS